MACPMEKGNYLIYVDGPSVKAKLVPNCMRMEIATKPYGELGATEYFKGI